MAESTATKDKAATKDDKAAKESEGGIEYVDKGTYWEIHDTRLGDDRVETAPKTQRDVPLPEDEQKELAERIEAENEAAEVNAEAAEQALEPPPVKEKDADVTVTAKGSEKA